MRLTGRMMGGDEMAKAEGSRSVSLFDPSEGGALMVIKEPHPSLSDIA